jgi:hypothetical protein
VAELDSKTPFAIGHDSEPIPPPFITTSFRKSRLNNFINFLIAETEGSQAITKTSIGHNSEPVPSISHLHGMFRKVHLTN